MGFFIGFGVFLVMSIVSAIMMLFFIPLILLIFGPGVGSIEILIIGTLLAAGASAAQVVMMALQVTGLRLLAPYAPTHRRHRAWFVIGWTIIWTGVMAPNVLAFLT